MVNQLFFPECYCPIFYLNIFYSYFSVYIDIDEHSSTANNKPFWGLLD